MAWREKDWAPLLLFLRHESGLAAFRLLDYPLDGGTFGEVTILRHR